MADNEAPRKNIYNANDPLDINELAALNDDISPEFIEQLQNQLSGQASEFIGKPQSVFEDDSTLFEETEKNPEETNRGAIPRISLDDSIDDNFIKKYKAKLKKQEMIKQEESVAKAVASETSNAKEVPNTDTLRKDSGEINIKETNSQPELSAQTGNVNDNGENKKQNDKNKLKDSGAEMPKIENLTSGNIIEKPIEQAQKEYNESLDYLDSNVNYSKYVIYIDPENKEFIESLTVRERKNLINKIIREQDDIAITKKRLGLIQTVIKHSIVAILTLAIAIPVIYITINASLEASINNYRRSQTIFQTLYKEKGKIKNK